MSWQDLCGDLPDHAAEVMAAHSSWHPALAGQSATHGAPFPAVDDGPDPGSVTG
jgi:hypothetical protein